ncbi:MAG: hypothetical protein OZ921_13440 [Sorangiineae bacterium]|nr:hypothetical protein [Polyangiaceae bacterium]MEB2323509.1 hypothetical protein [Sorangiineae bacterium]
MKLQTGIVYVAQLPSASPRASVWASPSAPASDPSDAHDHLFPIGLLDATLRTVLMSKLQALLATLVLGLVLLACGKHGRLTPPLKIELAKHTSKAIIGSDGGSIEVKSAAGTRYVLSVPAGALLGPVEITATAVASFGVKGPQGVVFGPADTHFLAPASLTISPSKPVPPAEQLLFTFSDDGAELWAAEPKLGSADMVVVVQHFTGYGFTGLADKAREAYVGWKTGRAESRIQNEIGEALQAERARQRSGDPSGSAATNKKIAESMDEWEREVVAPRLAAAGTSCAAAVKAVSTALGLERQRQLLNIPAKDRKAPSTAELIALMSDPCEKEAIAACQAKKDPSVLVAYWLGANRNRQLLGAADEHPMAGMLERAQAICEPQAYQVVGGLQDWKVSQKVCNIMKPFALSSSIGSMKFSGGLSGTYAFGGVFNAQYTGTYTISFPNGPRKPGTMVGTGGGSIAGQAGQGTEKYTLTPLGPAC